MNDENRELTVITGALLKFRMQAVKWMPSPPVSDSHQAITVYKLVPAKGDEDARTVLIASFSDVHAVYFTDDVDFDTQEED